MTDYQPDLNTSARDLGLLVLRIGVGAPALQAGLVKFLDLRTVIDYMQAGGWSSPTMAALMVSLAETVGGAFLLLGLLTPLAATAVVAAMIDAWLVNVSGAAFWSDPFNVPFVLAFAGTAVLLAGAGTHSLDHRLWGRATWPRVVSVTLLVVAISAAVTTWVVLNGTNPLHLTAPRS